MRLPDEDLVDAAMEAYWDHSWRGQRPMIYESQMPELLAVLKPVLDEFARKRSRVPARKPAKITNARRGTRPKSSIVPKKLRETVLLRDEGRCQRCGELLDPWWYSLQHRDARSMGGSRLLHSLANLVALCGTGTTGCHGYVESERTESYALGWLVPNGVTPGQWRVLRRGVWMQPGREWVEAAPSERQLELVEAGGFSAAEGEGQGD